MRKVIIRQMRHIAPFNEPAHALRILNKPLWQWHRDLLADYCDSEAVIDDFGQVPREPVEMLVYHDNLWFDKPFLDTFLQESRKRGRPTRAAFRIDDPAFLQQGLRSLTTSYERRGDLFYVNLWYFPQGLSTQVEPVIIASDSREVGYYHIPTYLSEKGDLSWSIPERAVCTIDTWVHVFYANIVFGLVSQAARSERRSGDALFKVSSMIRSLTERKPGSGISGDVQIGEGCHIDPSAVIQGPTIIGDNATIGPGCVITQSIIGDNVTLAHGNHFHMSVLSDNCFFPWGASAYYTVFMEDSSTAQNTSLEMSVIGRNSYIGGGTIFASFNLLPSPLHGMIEDPIGDAGIPVLGACVGHNCRLGSGLMVYPGRMIESDVVLVPSPTRRVIMNDISYEESDHHATFNAGSFPRLYPREDEQEHVGGGSQEDLSW